MLCLGRIQCGARGTCTGSAARFSQKHGILILEAYRKSERTACNASSKGFIQTAVFAHASLYSVVFLFQVQPPGVNAVKPSVRKARSAVEARLAKAPRVTPPPRQQVQQTLPAIWARSKPAMASEVPARNHGWVDWRIGL